jgi:DNA-binding transcriptional regulator YdaS (Cro superfamily)
MNIEKINSIFKSQKDLVAASGVTQQAVSKWFVGKTKPGIRVAKRIIEKSEGKLTMMDLRPDIFEVVGNEPDTSSNTTEADAA